jgi:starvation-inducible DNA-binding protein
MKTNQQEMNRIGLDKLKVEVITDGLNLLLSNYQVFYANVRGFHWNIKGEKFFELHVKFEELYNDLFLKIDEVAERILTLGGQPLHTYQDYLESATIITEKNKTSAIETVESVLLSFKILIKEQRDLLAKSSEANDEGTSALMSDYIREQEKLIWMYSAFQS